MRNLSLLTDLYQLSMTNSYIEKGVENTVANFDLFYRHRKTLDFVVCAGLQQAVDYLQNIKFTDDDLDYLRSLNLFGEKFFEVLKNFKFTGSVRAAREGEILFPNEPILSVTAPLYQAQIIETALLNIINHQTLIATKAFKICQEADGKPVLEFGLRRAQGPDAGIYGARAAIIGGCFATSNVLAAKMFNATPAGTHAHSFVMSFPTELEAFRAYAEVYPDNCMLLVDTYDTLKSGIPNAIKVFDELRAKGFKPKGIRLDSGDLAYLSKKARAMLDKAGYTDCPVCASGDIDEHILSSLKSQGAKIDIFGIGTKLITSEEAPSLGGVYKMSAIMENGKWVPKMKLSDTEDKITNPGIKTVYRIYGKDKMADADLICLKGEKLDNSYPLTIFHPVETWKTTTFEDYTVRELLTDIIIDGKVVYDFPSLSDVAAYAKKVKNEFWEEYRRLLNPHVYKVDLSKDLYDLKQSLIRGVVDFNALENKWNVFRG